MKKKNRTAYFEVKNQSGSTFELSADMEGVTRLDRLVLVDQKDGKEWELTINNGTIHVEPFDICEKRDFKIKKVISNGDK